MFLKAVGLVFLVLGLGAVALYVQSEGEAAPATPSAKSGFGALPLGIEANQGQAPKEARFIARGAGFEAAFGTAHVSVSPSKGNSARSAKLRWLDGVESAPVAEERLPGDAHYLVGNDPAGWLTQIPTYRRVRYPEVYPDIDLVYYGTQDELEYDFILAPSADPSLIAITLNDESGHPLALALDGEGNLSARVGEQTLTMRRPRVYQEDKGRRVDVDGEYRLLADARIGFRLGPYDSERTLVIDPVMSFSTYTEGYGSGVSDVTTDSLGDLYFTETQIIPGPEYNALIRVTKINSPGSAILYSTIFGGRTYQSFPNTRPGMIAIDGEGQAYIGGHTNALDFPTVNPIQPYFQGGFYDGFITKLSADGSTILYSSYFGDRGHEVIYAVAVDSAGSAFVAGGAKTLKLPGSPSFPPSGDYDAFVAKIHPAGGSLIYWTYLGGTERDIASAIKVDAAGNAVVAGDTISENFPVVTAHQSVHAGGTFDAFVASLDATGTNLRYSAYLGGSGNDTVGALALDSFGNPVVCGSTDSADFPVLSAAQAVIGGSRDSFVTVMDGVFDFTRISYSTFFGGAGEEQCFGLAVDIAGNAYFAGSASAPGLPAVRPLQPTFGGGLRDAYYAKLSTMGGPLLYSSYLGGSGSDQAEGVALFGSAMFIGGSTTSSNFPQVNALQPQFEGDETGFVTKISARADMGISMLDSPDPVRLQSTLTYSIAVTNLGPDSATRVILTDTIPQGASLLSATSSQGTCTPGPTVVCDLRLVNNPGSAAATIRVIPSQVGLLTNTATVSRFEEDPFAANDSVTVKTTVRSRLGVSIAAPNGAGGTVASNPAGINCGADCEEFYSSPTTVRLIATPASNSQFLGWSGACSGTGFCYVQMDQDRNVTATFRRVL